MKYNNKDLGIKEAVKLKRNEDDTYSWAAGDNATDGSTKSNAIAFGCWWLRIDQTIIKNVIEMMDETKHNIAFFSKAGEFLYVDSVNQSGSGLDT